MVESVLRDLGLSEREVKVYIALLEIGETTVGPIASKSRIQHSKIYQVIEKLVDKGLATFIIKSKTKYFQAQDPKFLLYLLKEKEKQLSNILPKLQLKRKFSNQRQTARVYEGYRAIQSLYEMLIDGLDKTSYYYVFPFKKEYLSSPFAMRFLRKAHLKLAEKKIDDRLIAHQSIKKQFKENYQGINNLKCRFTKEDFPLGLMIVNDKIINVIWGERPTAIEIRSEQLAEQYKKFFLEMWKKAKS